MSYTDDRDDLADLLGLDPGKQSGYSEEIPENPGPAAAPSKKGALPKPRKEAAAVKPVKMQPPEKEKAPPASPPPKRPVRAKSPKEPAPKPDPKTPPSSPSNLELDLQDLDDLDSFSLDVEPVKRTLKKPEISRRPKKEDRPQQEKPSPVPPERKQKPVPAEAPAPVLESRPKQPSRDPAPAVVPSAPAPEAKPATPAPSSPRETAAAPEKKAVSETAPASEAPFAKDRGKPTSEKFLLDTKGLVKIYDGRTVVNGVDINVRPGEIVGLLGPNGAGKTTSFYMIVGLVPPNGGRVLFNGNDVTQEPMFQRARLGMGYLPQEESIFRKLTVEENIMAVMETLSITKKERKARCDELLERFSITHIRKNVALTCSGGEKRRLTIARSLVTNPSLLMLDEPFSGVDPIAVNEIQSIVEDLRKSGLAILITDHNARQTLELVDRAYLIYEGKVLREGSRDFLINDPVSRELYLGDRFTM
ncbi:MAG: LPS export ABC transporter ATP-binding protein [Verrucomicrobiota bacterium]